MTGGFHAFNHYGDRVGDSDEGRVRWKTVNMALSGKSLGDFFSSSLVLSSPYIPANFPIFSEFVTYVLAYHSDERVRFLSPKDYTFDLHGYPVDSSKLNKWPVNFTNTSRYSGHWSKADTHVDLLDQKTIQPKLEIKVKPDSRFLRSGDFESIYISYFYRTPPYPHKPEEYDAETKFAGGTYTGNWS
jgi:hypothetical protein